MPRGVRYAVLGLVLVAGTALAQATGSITGVVTTAAKKPVHNAMVVAFNVDTGKTYDTATDAKGHYDLTELPAGGYEVSVSAEGYSDFDSDEIKVTAAAPARLDVTLKPEEN